MIKNYREKFSYLNIPDITNQIFLTVLSIISIIFYNRIDEWYFIVIVNTVLCVGITYVVSHYEKKSESDKRKPSLSRFIRYWYIVFMVLFCFKEIYILMIGLRPEVYDTNLIEIDRWIFGFDPTKALHFYSNPFLTEFLQIIYLLFYAMPVIYGLELYLWHRYEELKYATFVIFFGFYLSFFGYLAVPAIGPRFTLHNFNTLNTELPGIFLTDFIRDVINFGESIPKNISNPEFYAQRDAFPSGHTTMILIITYLSHKIKSKSFYFYFPYSVLMIFSTVYLRYHYVIDLIAGSVFALVTILISNLIYRKNRCNNNI